MQSPFRLLSATCLLGTLACNPSAAPATATPAEPAAATQPETEAGQTEAAPVDDARGGRLYDRWTAEAEVEFDAGKSGGPRGDGTLLDGGGKVLDGAGHGYRLKNLFGWDLRGAEGIYGPDYQNKPYVLSRNLLAKTQTEAELVEWLRNGDAEVPAFGEVLGDAELQQTAAFIAKMQRGELPGPDAFISLSKDAPKNYVLVEGADLSVGATAYEDGCASCHGDDGTDIPIHDTLSVGAFMRAKAYEGWIKVLNGHPGSPMGREIEFASAEEAASKTLGILAVLCDRTRFPALEGQEDVADGDLRCGSYLR
jgi:mono/diheme cytochrome c family protein